MLLSCVILTLNEASNIAGCVASAGWCDEILVVDSGSTDLTREIAAGIGARVVVRPFESYGAQRQFALEQARGEWVFMLDADERATPALAAEVRAAALGAPPATAAFEIPHREYILGMWMLHGGWSPQPHARLLRRSAARFVGGVHETVQGSRARRRLRNPILHFSHLTVSNFLTKLERYTSIEADERFARGERVPVWRLAAEPALYFAYKYVVQRGVLDGSRGFIVAALLGVYRFVLLAKIRTLAHHPSNDPAVGELLRAHGVEPRTLP